MYDEENNEIIPTEQVSEDTTEETAEQTQEQPFEETPAEDAVTAANPYKQMSEQDYKGRDYGERQLQVEITANFQIPKSKPKNKNAQQYRKHTSITFAAQASALLLRY